MAMRVISSVPTMAMARKYPAPSQSHGAWLRVDFLATGRFIEFILRHPCAQMFVLAPHGAEPQDAAFAALVFQHGNGPVVPLVASAGANIFIASRFPAHRRRDEAGRVCFGEKIRRPVKKR
jgi:hypothetical protein